MRFGPQDSPVASLILTSMGLSVAGSAIATPIQNFFTVEIQSQNVDFSDLENRRSKHLLGGGRERQEEQRSKKKMTAFERVDLLFDPGTFVELDQLVLHDCHDFDMDKKVFLGDGVV